MRTDKYKKLVADSNANNDGNSCTVLAGCVAFDLSYEQSYKLLERFGGRKKNDGLTTPNCWKGYSAINKFLGLKDRYQIKKFTRREIRVLADDKTMTINNCTNYLNPRKSYIVFVSRHAVGVKNGIVHDWSQGTKRPVIDLFEVTDTESELVAEPVQKVFKMGGFSAVLDGYRHTNSNL
tara:strand:+ start:651 stop:1187 length:537 start_codon:yes stop_codon:yes gene_type:complete